jgi:hypothetical protein
MLPARLRGLQFRQSQCLRRAAAAKPGSDLYFFTSCVKPQQLNLGQGPNRRRTWIYGPAGSWRLPADFKVLTTRQQKTHLPAHQIQTALKLTPGPDQPASMGQAQQAGTLGSPSQHTRMSIDKRLKEAKVF